MVFVLWRTVFILFCNTAAEMEIAIIPAVVTCYLFFRCRIEKVFLELFFFLHPPPTHTSFTDTSLFTYTTRVHTFFDTWVEMFVPFMADVIS